MVSVYIDDAGDVRSTNSGRIVAPAGTTHREARIQAALWASAADALQTATTAAMARRAEGPRGRAEGLPAVVAPTPISAAPSYVRTVQDTRQTLAVVDVGQMFAETAQALKRLSIFKEPS